MADLIQPVRGMNDVLPADAPLWDRVEGAAAELFAAYGYQRVRLARARADGALQPLDRRAHRHRLEGDVHVRRSRRERHDAPGGDRRRRARRARQRTAAQPATEALVQRPDVPAREAAEGALPPIPSAQRRGARLRRARDRRGADRAVRASLEDARHHERHARAQLDRHARGARRLQEGARRSTSLRTATRSTKTACGVSSATRSGSSTARIPRCAS